MRGSSLLKSQARSFVITAHESGRIFGAPAAASIRQLSCNSVPSARLVSLKTFQVPILKGQPSKKKSNSSRALPVMASGSASSLPTPVVEPAWLLENLGEVKLLDASWYMPAEKRKPFEEFQALRIPEAQFFDVDKISDPTSKLPHMLPSEVAFSRAASALGLSNSDRIVIYDGKGIFSAARAWWMFRVFGHDDVAVLDGGIPLWQSLGLPAVLASSEDAAKRHEASIEAVKASYRGEEASSPLTFRAKKRDNLVLSIDQVLANVDSKKFQVIDARSAGRFQGTDPEPRPGLSSGSIPGSINVPFPRVLAPNNTLLCPVALEETFHEAGYELTSPVPSATSCGTGVTACILALALFRLGKKDVPVYDGSWTEWASTPNTPILSKQQV